MNRYHRQNLTRHALRNQQGLSLVELMVAMALGIFLTWGATQAFLTGKQTYSMQQALSRIQENGRMAQEFFGYDIRNAGGYGCATGQFIVASSSANNLTNKANDEFNFENSVYGADNVPATAAAGLALATGLNPVPVAGTDILIVHTGTNLGLEVLAAPAPTATSARVNNLGLVTGDILAMGNCTAVTILKPTSISSGTISYGFGTAPAVGSSVMKLDTAIYYVANNPDGQPALYRRLLGDGGTSQELLTGVENLQLEYGIQNATYNTIDFRTANAIGATQWSSWVAAPVISAVRYSLLMRSENQLLDTPQTYTYNGVTVTAPATDRRLRQVFTGTVGIRGQLQ